MLRFECDYSEGAHPSILQKLAETNLEQTPGYGEDPHCQRARELIRQACQFPGAAVEFLPGGTQTNQTVIAAALRPYQGAVCADTGHIHVHETGAVEAAGHKVLPLPGRDGKLTAQQVEALCIAHWSDPVHEHTVQPGLLYLSQPTELGTMYTKRQLTDLRRVCQKYGLFLYVDGARCGYGLAAPDNDVQLTDLAQLCDAFSIGGTKVGALLGEAVVIPNPALQRDFRYMVKRQGGMLAKGRLLGIQFEVLFEDGLYFQLGRHGVELALQLRRTFEDCGVELAYPSFTNQQFPILTRSQWAELSKSYAFSHWQDLDGDRIMLRVCTSWATQPQAVEQLCRDIRRVCGGAV